MATPSAQAQANSPNSLQLLQRFLNNQNANLDILHDLMPFRVREILLITTLYDAFSIEKEGRFTQHILGAEYKQNIINMPRITGVTTIHDALQKLQSKSFDLTIIVGGSDKYYPFDSARRIKEEHPEQTIYLLLNDTSELTFFKQQNLLERLISRIFIWDGDSKVFFAMIKSREDAMNVENDTKVGLIKVILLVEDSEQYYSKYLPLLYNTVMAQTQKIVEAGADPLVIKLRQRLRPKILLALHYEEAMQIARQYQENLMCLITDMEFPIAGQLNKDAGAKLIQAVRELNPDLPTVIQSSESDQVRTAYELQSIFINKQSETLLPEIKSFINHQLGFGNIVFRDGTGQKIAQARTLEEFIKQFDTIPDESLVYHARRNHFSLWLMARGEIRAAKIIYPIKTTDFESLTHYREQIKFIINRYRNESLAGKIIDFAENALLDETNVVRMGTGELGGKGRGLAFINTLIYNLNFSNILPGINIRTPSTSIIGTDEYDVFMEQNHMLENLRYERDDKNIKGLFLKGNLSYSLSKKLKAFVRTVSVPIAVRSSGLTEDSPGSPLSGMYATYLLPNNHPDTEVRFRQLSDAVKLVYASAWSTPIQSYLSSINRNAETEKMAVVLQDLVGRQYENYFYPHISGTAQSHNFYPFANTTPDDGCATLAVGLGKYVVEAGKAYRFSPKHPTLEGISLDQQVRNTQTRVLVVDLTKKEPDMYREGEYAGLTEIDIYDAEKHGTLKHCASVYDAENERIVPGLDRAGPRVINFANILKYNYLPLAHTLDVILDIVREAMGSAVEIEFAIDLQLDASQQASFYLLQIKPLRVERSITDLPEGEVNREDALVLSSLAMGNGFIENIYDIIYVVPGLFDKTRTLEMAEEIDRVNKQMISENRQYILIGPGRWGSRDRFIGIPVTWPQISHAKVIVETSLPDFPLDASLGSHFFHNVTSMRVGYFSVQHNSPQDLVQWAMLDAMPHIGNYTFLRHVQVASPLNIYVDGQKQKAVIAR